MPSPELVFRFDTAASPLGRAELARLIRDEFDIDVTPLDRTGHDPSIVGFGWWAGNELVANVSLHRRTLWLTGKPVEAFGLQSVAVRPPWRGRGLFRDLMARALAHADARVGLVTLTTETPALYTPFGFRAVAESSFAGPLAPDGTGPNHRRLSLDLDADLALLRDLFARRAPVSHLCAAIDHPALFVLKAITSPEVSLLHLPDLDAIVAVEVGEPGELTLLDVVAPEIPPFAAIAAALASPAGRGRVFVTPDRLTWSPTETEDQDSGLMVRGRFAAEGLAIALSPMQV